MKRLILVLFIVLYQSCATKKFHRTYILENGTNHNISIMFYTSGNVKSEYHLTENGDTLKGIAESNRGGTTAGIAFGADSAVVIFNVDKIIMFNLSSVKPTENRNIFKNREYTIESNELYRFIFTEEDYNNAEDCGGPCD